MKTIAVALIRIYQKTISPLLPPTCRHYPTCSNYAIQAYDKYGFLKGTYLTVMRIARCNPLFPGGYDPVK